VGSYRMCSMRKEITSPGTIRQVQCYRRRRGKKNGYRLLSKNILLVVAYTVSANSTTLFSPLAPHTTSSTCRIWHGSFLPFTMADGSNDSFFLEGHLEARKGAPACEERTSQSGAVRLQHQALRWYTLDHLASPQQGKEDWPSENCTALHCTALMLPTSQ